MVNQAPGGQVERDSVRLGAVLLLAASGLFRTRDVN